VINWLPFQTCPSGERPPIPRKLHLPEGLGDRMRTAAFAERQAVVAFAWAADHFSDAPEAVRQQWRAQVAEEQVHCDLISARMAELGFALDDRPVSLGLWETLQACKTGEEFAISIAKAEDRGRQAGLRMVKFLTKSDPTTAALFQKIADDEIAHIALPTTHYGWQPDSD
jgi:uncharacterized ferritin-like protein (DUF455 family)